MTLARAHNRDTVPLKELEIGDANKVLPINPLGPIVKGLYFSSDNVSQSGV